MRTSRDRRRKTEVSTQFNVKNLIVTNTQLNVVMTQADVTLTQLNED
jgi:hypothetical protein